MSSPPLGRRHLLGVALMIVALTGVLLWWLLVTFFHVNLVTLVVAGILLGLYGTFTAWTGLQP